MNLPKVSVIVPNYNHADFLKQRLNSVIEQSYQNFELIILDDYSQDNSRSIIEEYRGNPKVSHIIFNSCNSGTTFKQWDKGISLATGEWVWIAESDDWCEPTFLESLVSNIDSSYAVAFCQSITVNVHGRCLWLSKAESLASHLVGVDFMHQNMLKGCAIFNSSMAIFKREHYTNISKDFTSFKLCGDWLFWIQMLLQGNVFISGKVLNYFRKHDKDVSGKAAKNGLLYSEYLKLVDLLVAKTIISSESRKNLYLYKYKELALDIRIDESIKNNLIKIYLDKIGNNLFNRKSFYLLGKRVFLKSLMKKYVKTNRYS